MSSLDSFVTIEARLRAGDQDAATEINRRFNTRLIALADARLGARLRRKEDPEDVVQSVLRTFFIRQRSGKYDLANWNSLWNLLTVITKRKCLNRVKYYLAKRRNIRVEVGDTSSNSASDGPNEPIDREPTGSKTVVLEETVEQMMRRFAPDERTIIELILRGHDPLEISTRLGISERKAKRVGYRVEQVLLKEIEADETCAP
jgi:RNA polymerase sigma-70 factor (ECF subfamily)